VSKCVQFNDFHNQKLIVHRSIILPLVNLST